MGHCGGHEGIWRHRGILEVMSFSFLEVLGNFEGHGGLWRP